MSTNIWVVVGYSGSGKTTLTQELGMKLNLPIVSYNNFLAELAHQKGYSHKNDYFRNTPIDKFKQELDQYGKSQIDALAEISNAFLVEGICSLDGFIALRSDTSKNVRLFHICVPEGERIRRIEERDGSVFQPKERHKKMLGLDELVKLADYVIDGMDTTTSVVSKMIEVISNYEEI